MPVAEEIRELHTVSRPKMIDHDVREIWRAENPNRNPNDLYSQPSEVKWKLETKAHLEDFSNRLTFESTTHQLLNKIDENVNLQFKPKSDGTYNSLMERFADNEIGAFGNKWEIPNDAMKDFKTLLSVTDEHVQRNAGNLETVVKIVREIASEEVGQKAKRDAEARNDPNINPNVESAQATKDWQTSKLNQSIESVEKALADWDKLLAEKALPEASKLKAEADKLNACLHEFYREHIVPYGQDKTAPFVKHQVLATMRSVSEMVASQYAARLGTPSLSAAHRLILEVPLSGTYKASTDKESIRKIAAKAPASGAMWDLAKGLSNERETFMSQLKKSDKASHDKLAAKEFSALDKSLEANLTKWRKAYDAVGSGDKSKVNQLYEATADFAFQFKNYKEAIERTLKNSPASEKAKKDYLATLDTFVSTLSGGLQVGRKIMS
jgi:hypothetical protein